MERLKRIGIVPNFDKRDMTSAAIKLIEWLKARDMEVRLDAKNAALIGLEGLGFKEKDDFLRGLDALITLGGDGTLLNAARYALGTGIPLLGVNFGHLGFLTEIEVGDLYDQLPTLLEGRGVLEERAMVRADVNREGQSAASFWALNDVVVTKGAFARLILLKVYVDDTLLAEYPADGIILATPTGSTAYSLSAGGPIVSPNLNVLILTPICAHSLFARPVVISRDEKVTIEVIADHQEKMLTMDGQRGYRLQDGNRVVISTSETSTRLLRMPCSSFYEVLRRKMQGGS